MLIFCLLFVSRYFWFPFISPLTHWSFRITVFSFYTFIDFSIILLFVDVYFHTIVVRKISWYDFSLLKFAKISRLCSLFFPYDSDSFIIIVFWQHYYYIFWIRSFFIVIIESSISFLSCIFNFFSKFGKFSAIISLNKLFVPFSLSSPSVRGCFCCCCCCFSIFAFLIESDSSYRVSKFSSFNWNYFYRPLSQVI